MTKPALPAAAWPPAVEEALAAPVGASSHLVARQVSPYVPDDFRRRRYLYGF